MPARGPGERPNCGDGEDEDRDGRSLSRVQRAATHQYSRDRREVAGHMSSEDIAPPDPKARHTGKFEPARIYSSRDRPLKCSCSI